MDPSRKSEFRMNAGAAVRVVLVLIASALLVSCGFALATGGTSGTGFSKGPIEEFGSIIVGDVRWNVRDAEIVFDGEVVEIPDDFVEDEVDALFDLGQVVTVEGLLDEGGLSGDATRVVFDEAIEGPVIDDPFVVPPGGMERELNVLGYIVVITPSTTYTGGAGFDTLEKEDVVEVSGLVDGNVVYATWIDLVGRFEEGVTTAELHGIVTDLSTSGGGGEFEIGDVKVSYSATTDFDGFEGGGLEEGQRVEVEGVLGDIDELDADRIELEFEGLPFDDAENVEIKGIVSGFVGEGSPFTVSGVQVDASRAVIEGLLEDGAEVEVEGDLVGGVLFADEVEVEDDDDDDDQDEDEDEDV